MREQYDRDLGDVGYLATDLNERTYEVERINIMDIEML